MIMDLSHLEGLSRQLFHSRLKLHQQLFILPTFRDLLQQALIVVVAIRVENVQGIWGRAAFLDYARNESGLGSGGECSF